MRIEQLRLRQRDGVTCGPSVAIVGSALLDVDYARGLPEAEWFADEQGRVHRRLNRWWPRALGTTPVGMVRALSRHSAVPYRWRPARCRRDTLLDVREAVLLGYPVAMLVGRFVPRHWVLLVETSGTTGFRCYEPSSGEIRLVAADDIRAARLTGVGYPRPFAFVLPAGGGERRAWRQSRWAAATVDGELLAAAHPPSAPPASLAAPSPPSVDSGPLAFSKFQRCPVGVCAAEVVAWCRKLDDICEPCRYRRRRRDAPRGWVGRRARAESLCGSVRMRR